MDLGDTDIALKAANPEKSHFVLNIHDLEDDKAAVNYKYCAQDNVSFTHSGESLAVKVELITFTKKLWVSATLEEIVIWETSEDMKPVRFPTMEVVMTWVSLEKALTPLNLEKLITSAALKGVEISVN